MLCDDWPRLYSDCELAIHCSTMLMLEADIPSHFDIRVDVIFIMHAIIRAWRKTLMWSISLHLWMCATNMSFSYAYKLRNEIPWNTLANLSIRQFCVSYVKQYACGARYPTKIIIQRRLPHPWVCSTDTEFEAIRSEGYARRRRRRQHTR